MGEEAPGSSLKDQPTRQSPPPPSSPFPGIFLTLGLHVAGIAVVAMLDPTGMNVAIAAGLLGGFQVLYMVPAILIVWWMRKPMLLKGLLIGAGMTFLLNALCVGLVLVAGG